MRSHPLSAVAVVLALTTRVAAASPADTATTERIVANRNLTPAGTLRRGVLAVDLELRTGLWFPEADDGRSLRVHALGERGRPLQIPGPLLRVEEGTRIRATLRNTLPDSTLVIYGLHTRPGGPGDSLHVPPGSVRSIEFEAGAPGTYFYWGTTTGKYTAGPRGIDSQISGALLVYPRGAPPPPDERVFVMGFYLEGTRRTEGGTPVEVMVINGKSWPHTERFDLVVGDSVRWRWINASNVAHPMHLHGFYFRVDSRGGWAADTVYAEPDRRLAVTEMMMPWSTNSLQWVPEREGNWLFHCHFAFHVSHHLILRDPSAPVEEHGGEHGAHRMAGLVLGMTVAPRGDAVPASAEPVPPRRMRLLVQSAPGRFGSDPGMSYVLHEGGPEPPPDSVPATGPTLILRRGQPVAITIVNRMAEPTAVHWHGIELESFPDGVPGWSGSGGRIMPPIAPGDSFTAEFVPPRSGTFIYHTHANELAQISSGLYGALLVLDPDETYDPERDRVILVGSAGPANDFGLVNGVPEPPAMDLRMGETYRFRLININADWRVMFSLVSDEGYERWRPIAKDGADLPPHQATMRPAHLLTGPGETADFEFTPARPGELRLEVKTQLSGWHIPVPLRVRE